MYTILIFDSLRATGRDSYSNSYAGQSLKVYHRVCQHLSGKGNGDVYADYRGGKCLLIRIEVCEEDQLNDLEKERISELDPRRRYNMNSGGATSRPYAGEAPRSTRCRITIKRADTVVNQGVKSTVLLDGKEVKKLRSGEGTKVSTTEGFHRLEVKAFGSRTLSESVDLREGDVIVIKPTLLGWEYRIERKQMLETFEGPHVCMNPLL